MGRKKVASRVETLPDPKFNDVVVATFINSIMIQGKRSVAESIFYDAVDIITQRGGDDGLKTFKKGLENVKPLLEVKSRRVGGATYQVPVEVKPQRRQSLASRWIIGAARGRNEHSMAEKLAGELMDAANLRGGAVKKREDVHKMAESNKVFAHFRW